MTFLNAFQLKITLKMDIRISIRRLFLFHARVYLTLGIVFAGVFGVYEAFDKGATNGAQSWKIK